MTYESGFWGLAAIHIGWLMMFALPLLRPIRRREWRPLGVFGGFVVALYAEMYGFPLTIYALTALLGRLPVPEPFAHASGNLWATLVLGPRAAGPLMLLGGLLILAGVIVLSAAWRTLYMAQGNLVTRGPYAVVRHPQYSALFLVIVGALVQWPTIPTLLMAPILVVAYVRLAWREEAEMEARFGAAYRRYRRQVHGFVPAMPLPSTSRPAPPRRSEQPGARARVGPPT
jgi:protein-S-isoprenylcysteine O-methyltransferase Ste14